ncbi:MAG: TraB/GumN family protein [Gammaproteobacteria bacterium SHHR-1]|uniref:TraB/GumN family protein n=1 Tax=Magnetovirga frankeli TaxID=947516 RepID=UPI001293E381|nr:TraB/GumN family protein [gamma proteobacterium SS-5]
MSETQQPLIELDLEGSRISLLGTAHVSRVSAESVRQLLQSGRFDAVAVELCPSRYNAMLNPDVLAQMDLFRVFREGKAMLVMANLALGAYQQRMADQFGIQPGEEFRVAIEQARAAGYPVMLIDREVATTLKRTIARVRWWQRLEVVGLLLASVISKEQVSEEEIERLKEGDMLESAFGQFAEQSAEIFQPLVAERDRYMAARLRQEVRSQGPEQLLVVVGAGHLKGMAEALQQPLADPEAVITELDQMPRKGSRWLSYLPWLIVTLVVGGFAIGFSRSPNLGWSLVADWVLINGGLSALGALLAAAHPLTVLTAFLAAPLTSLNPTIGAGMVTAAAEVYLRKPRVGDFSRLRQDTTALRGWWQNRVSRTLLVFLFSTLGSAVGTYVAGFRIFDKLAG